MLLLGAMLVKYAFYLGMAGMLVVSLVIYRKLELRLWQALLFTVVAFLSDGLGAFLMGKVYTAFVASLGSTETATYSIYGAVFLTPVLVIASAAIIKQPWRNIIDMVAISEMVARAFGKLGCHVGYCCAGFEWEHGVYNARFDTNMFPTQLCEFFTMVIIIIVGFVILFRSKKYKPGTLYPLTALMYAGTRFFWEFTRYYNYEQEKNFFLGMTLWQVCSVIAAALAIVWLIGIKNNWLEKAQSYVLSAQYQKLEAQKAANAKKKRKK